MMRLSIRPCPVQLSIDVPPVEGEVEVTVADDNHEVFNWVVQVTAHIQATGRLPEVVPYVDDNSTKCP